MQAHEPNIDQARRLPHLRASGRVEVVHAAPLVQQTKPISVELKPGASSFDPERLRGIPAIGRNVAGHISGTNPESVIRA